MVCGMHSGWLKKGGTKRGHGHRTLTHTLPHPLLFVK